MRMGGCVYILIVEMEMGLQYTRLCLQSSTGIYVSRLVAGFVESTRNGYRKRGQIVTEECVFTDGKQNLKSVFVSSL